MLTFLWLKQAVLTSTIKETAVQEVWYATKTKHTTLITLYTFYPMANVNAFLALKVFAAFLTIFFCVQSFDWYEKRFRSNQIEYPPFRSIDNKGN